ncbi:MAG: MaoC family dehydratase N-terminal domain-containing protein [Smithellaceae bacterium]
MMADKSKLGMEFPLYSIRIEKNKIAEFVAAVAQKDDIACIEDIYRDEEAARQAGYGNIPLPPTFGISFVLWTGGGLPAIIEALGVDICKLLHAGEEYEYLGPIYAGDVITRKMKVVDMFERGRKNREGWSFLVTILETEITNQRGELVLRARTTFMER